MIKLSILIPTVKGREEKLQRLMDILDPQFDELLSESISSGEMPIEILIKEDNKELSIGSKRQLLIEQANGEYIVFIDDDDTVSTTYIRDILNNTGSDAIGFLIDCYSNGKFTGTAKASNKYNDWGEYKEGFRYVRTIYHKTPHLRKLALQTGFKNMRYGEDYDYCTRLKPLIKSEAFINKVLYFYQYNDEEFNAKYGIK